MFVEYEMKLHNGLFEGNDTIEMVCSRTLCTGYTLALNASNAGGDELDIFVDLGEGMVELPYHFVYLPNPKISKVYPLKTVVSGGNTVTVEGEFHALTDLLRINIMSPRPCPQCQRRLCHLAHKIPGKVLGPGLGVSNYPINFWGSRSYFQGHQGSMS